MCRRPVMLGGGMTIEKGARARAVASRPAVKTPRRSQWAYQWLSQRDGSNALSSSGMVLDGASQRATKNVGAKPTSLRGGLPACARRSMRASAALVLLQLLDPPPDQRLGDLRDHFPGDLPDDPVGQPLDHSLGDEVNRLRRQVEGCSIARDRRRARGRKRRERGGGGRRLTGRPGGRLL